MTRARSRRGAGFTLVELLVVIAIIAVLASLILPAMDKAKARAKLSRCISNQRQIGLSFHLYTQDYDDYFPRHSALFNYGGKAGANTNSGGATEAGARPMTAYTRSTDVFSCPSDEGRLVNGVDIKSCWRDFGNSYVTPWATDIMGQVTADSNRAWDDVSGLGRPGKMSNFAISPQNKVIQGDAGWLTLWAVDRPRRWHPPASRRTDFGMRMVSVKGPADDLVLFADNHVGFIFVPRDAGVFAVFRYTGEWW
jgi:prepilin-type N-terminal cleavage/methylation domain-containing protein